MRADRVWTSREFRRCHLSELFRAARITIYAALIAARITADRASLIAWVKREKPSDTLAGAF